MGPFKLGGGGGSVQSTAGSRGVSISGSNGSNAGYHRSSSMLDTPCSEVECKTTGYPLHSHVPPSLPLPCVTVCHQVSTELYQSDFSGSYPIRRMHIDRRLPSGNSR